MTQKPRDGLFGERQAKSYQLSDIATQVLDQDQTRFFALTHLRSREGVKDPTPASPKERAFLVPVHLVEPDSSSWATWIDGKPVEKERWELGGVGIFDLDSQPTALRNTSFETVHYYIPRSTLNTYTEEEGLSRVTTFENPKGKKDEFLLHLSRAVLPALREGEHTRVFWESFQMMICDHLVRTYTDLRRSVRVYRGGLTSWQRRTVLDQIHSGLCDNVRIADLAMACGISSGHLSRSFRQTFGMTIHSYLVQQRIETAKSLLKNGKLSLSEIAMQIGFCDQAAFSRTFGKEVGVTPARWRREVFVTSRVI